MFTLPALKLDAPFVQLFKPNFRCTGIALPVNPQFENREEPGKNPNGILSVRNVSELTVTNRLIVPIVFECLIQPGVTRKDSDDRLNPGGFQDGTLWAVVKPPPPFFSPKA